MSPDTSWAERLYWRTRAALVPDLENSQFAYAERLRGELSSAKRWLDLGCGHGWFPPFVKRRVAPLDLGDRRVVGIDMDRTALARHPSLAFRVNGSGEHLPFRAGVFDLVSANMMLEHVSEPEKLFAEVARVLAPSGRFLVHTPNGDGYTTALTHLVPPALRSKVAGYLQEREAADVYPTFYHANTSSVLHRLAAASQMQVTSIDYLQTSPQLIKVPPLMLVEMLVIRALANPRRQRRRACLIAVFQKI
jgi:ubiquinone/menaquinone biosynthesis C-methylase UbiE